MCAAWEIQYYKLMYARTLYNIIKIKISGYKKIVMVKNVPLIRTAKIHITFITPTVLPGFFSNLSAFLSIY